MNREALYLGVDGGGSKTTAVVMNEAGVELGRGHGGPGNIATMPDHLLRDSLTTAIHAANRATGLADGCSYDSVCAGMAGYSAQERRESFLALLREVTGTPTCLLQPDYSIAYWGATHGEPGVVIIAGTGAVAFGRNPDGDTDREDGLGYLLGDRGSGFDLGLRLLRHTVERLTEGKRDPLTEAVCARIEAGSPEQVIHWLYTGFVPARVAAIAPVVGPLSDAGEPSACYHVAETARRLRHSVERVRLRLEMGSCAVYPLGGLWNLGEFFREEFRAPHWQPVGEIAMKWEYEEAQPFTVAPPRNDAAYGAALYAREQRRDRIGKR